MAARFWGQGAGAEARRRGGQSAEGGGGIYPSLETPLEIQKYVKCL